MLDLGTYEPLSSYIAYDIALADDAEKYIFEDNISNPKYVKIDITKDLVRFYVIGDIVETVSCDGGVVYFNRFGKKATQRFDPICLDAVVKRELYNILQHYNVRNIDSCSINLNGIEVYNFIFYPSKLERDIYDKDNISITRSGKDILDLIRMISYAYADYVRNKNTLSEEIEKELKDNGIQETFFDFINNT
jgi:hypothetical protein